MSADASVQNLPAPIETTPATTRALDQRTAKAMIAWLTAVSLLIVGMVVVGGITRLTQSGLSIVEWKPVTGAIPPLTEQAWQAEFLKYQQFPQFRLQFHGTMTLEQFKGIFFWEWFHRLLGRLLGLAYGLPLVWFWTRATLDAPLRRALLIGLFLGGSQGALGWFMVKSGLVHMPHVSHYRLAAHLLLAFTTLAWLEWIALGLRSSSVPRAKPDASLRTASRVFFGLLVVQIAWGAFTAGLRAGYGYPTWPTMNGSWIPSPFWASIPGWTSVFEHPPTVQWMHRWIGTSVGVYALALAVFGARRAKDSMVRNALVLVGGMALVQFVLGVVTVLTSVSVPLAVTHQVFGCLLFAAGLYLLHTQRSLET